jgi:hypothetical protein
MAGLWFALARHWAVEATRLIGAVVVFGTAITLLAVLAPGAS